MTPKGFILHFNYKHGEPSCRLQLITTYYSTLEMRQNMEQKAAVLEPTVFFRP